MIVSLRLPFQTSLELQYPWLFDSGIIQEEGTHQDVPGLLAIGLGEGRKLH